MQIQNAADQSHPIPAGRPGEMEASGRQIQRINYRSTWATAAEWKSIVRRGIDEAIRRKLLQRKNQRRPRGLRERSKFKYKSQAANPQDVCNKKNTQPRASHSLLLRELFELCPYRFDQR